VLHLIVTAKLVPISLIIFTHSILRSELQLLVTGNVPSSLIIFMLKLKAISSSETSVLTRAMRRHISEEDIIRSGNSFCNNDTTTIYTETVIFEGHAVA
jgi:hypothetical protein